MKTFLLGLAGMFAGIINFICYAYGIYNIICAFNSFGAIAILRMTLAVMVIIASICISFIIGSTLEIVRDYLKD